MRKKRNAGFSIAEVLIALAIFLILMIPIVKGIVQALNMSTGSKELQYRNDFAEGIMEHVKSVQIDELLDSKYYLDSGTDSSTFTTTKSIYTTDTSNPDRAGDPIMYDRDGDGSITADEYFEYAQYQIRGQVELGTKHEKYNYLVDVDSKPYAEAGSLDAAFLDPNNLSLGIIEDIDYTKVALIDDSIFNYDSTAETAFAGKKLQGLKAVSEEDYFQAIRNNTNPFQFDPAYRMMTIKVSGDATNGYKVECVLDYYDPSTYISGNDSYLEYCPYAKTFKGEMPNIYVMYNPCIYNRDYATDDYIMLDTADLDDTESPINIFLIEVSSNFSSSIVDSGALDYANAVDGSSNFTADQSLFKEGYNYANHRDSVNIHLGGCLSAVSGTSNRLSQIHLYTNIGDNTETYLDETGAEQERDKVNKKTDESKFITTEYPSSDSRFSNFWRVYAVTNDNVSRACRLTRAMGGSDQVIKGKLIDASESSRGMYNVKVYLKKASDGEIDVTSDLPILQGTKGGSES